MHEIDGAEQDAYTSASLLGDELACSQHMHAAMYGYVDRGTGLAPTERKLDRQTCSRDLPVAAAEDETREACSSENIMMVTNAEVEPLCHLQSVSRVRMASPCGILTRASTVPPAGKRAVLHGAGADKLSCRPQATARTQNDAQEAIGQHSNGRD